MPRFYKIIGFLFLVIFLSACSASSLDGLNLSGRQPAHAAGLDQEPTATRLHYQPPADSTATPTPFQPIPPTEVYLPTEPPTPTLPPLPTATLKPPASTRGGSLGALQPPNQMNILLLGSDKRPGGGGFRTDTIILATLNMDLGTVSMTSFPRDLYVNIPGVGTNRINTAWQNGGFKKLAETMEANFGIRPDHYVLIDFTSFKRIIDSLGGVDVKVKQPVSDYYHGRWVTVEKGERHMNADFAMWYVRTRKTTSDFYRARRQQEVLKAVFEKMLSMNGIQRIPEFYEIYKQYVTTDMTWEDMLAWLPLATKMTDSSHLRHYYVGPKAAYDWITYEGAMVLIPVKSEIQIILREALNIP